MTFSATTKNWSLFALLVLSIARAVKLCRLKELHKSIICSQENVPEVPLFDHMLVLDTNLLDYGCHWCHH